MRFERLRPGQLRDAIEQGVPFVLPIGVMEYHGGHLPVDQLGRDVAQETLVPRGCVSHSRASGALCRDLRHVLALDRNGHRFCTGLHA